MFGRRESRNQQPLLPKGMRAACLCIAIVIAGALTKPTHALPVVLPNGTQAQLVDESAIIVWNPARHREHIIQRVLIKTNASDAGFLIPTPSPPTVTYVDDAFYSVERQLGTQIRVHFHPYLTPVFWLNPDFNSDPLAKARVENPNFATARMIGWLYRKHAAPYGTPYTDTETVLPADKPDALLHWLQAHGYEARPALREWLAPM